MPKDALGHGSDPHGGLDHGQLNVPLSKRQGNIDVRLQQYVANQQRQANVHHKELLAGHRAMMAEAKSLILGMSNERAAELGKPHGLTAKQTREQLLSAARSNPERALRSLRKG